MGGERRRRFEIIEGITIDGLLVAAAVAASEDAVQDYLQAHPSALYHGLVLIHLIACPAMLVAIVVGYGKAGSREEIQRTDFSWLGFAAAFLFAGSFVVPAVLGLAFRPPVWEYMGSIFAPIVVFPLWMAAIIVAEKRGWIAPAKIGEKKHWLGVQSLALLTWAYLLWLETMMLVVAPQHTTLTRVGLPIGVLIDYLPIRVALYYVRDSSKWERITITLSVAHLLYRLATA